MARIKRAKPDDELTLVEHLDELRTRLIVSISVLVVAVSAAYYENHRIYHLLTSALPKGHRQLYTFAPGEDKRAGLQYLLDVGDRMNHVRLVPGDQLCSVVCLCDGHACVLLPSRGYRTVRTRWFRCIGMRWRHCRRSNSG